MRLRDSPKATFPARINTMLMSMHGRRPHLSAARPQAMLNGSRPSIRDEPIAPAMKPLDGSGASAPVS